MNVRILLENNNIHVFVCEYLPLTFCNNDDNMAMMQVLVDCPSRKIIDSHYLALDLAHHIKFPGEPGQCHVIDLLLDHLLFVQITRFFFACGAKYYLLNMDFHCF